jgi:hypothetical protein
MGVDQYTSAHRFDDLPDGGRIELQRTVDDPAGVQPGTKVMAEKRALIRYSYADLPRGGEVRLRSSDPEAISAIHAFLAFQRGDHHAAGHSLHR